MTATTHVSVNDLNTMGVCNATLLQPAKNQFEAYTLSQFAARTNDYGSSVYSSDDEDSDDADSARAAKDDQENGWEVANYWF